MAATSAVIFDLDGTLFDHREAASRALGSWLADLKVVLTDDLLVAWFEAESRHFRAWQERRITFAEQRRRRLRDFLPLLGLAVEFDDDLDVRFTGYLHAYEQAWVGFDDVEEALRDVHRLGLVTAVLTNGTTAQQEAKLCAIGLLGRIGPVVTAESLGVAKPHRAAFGLACARLDLPPPHVLYVGDNHATDIVAARAAGLRALHLDRLDAGPFSERDRITTMRGLVPFITSTGDTKQ